MIPAIHIPLARPGAALRLVCFPYAGGNSSIFFKWPAQLPPDVELVCVDPPGRAAVCQQAPVDRLPVLADLVSSVLWTWLDRPFALFGHSNGALLAFEVARRLHHRGRAPALFVASAKTAPSRIKEEPLHRLSDGAFLEELRAMGGTPEAFFHSIELQQLLLPTIRADFALSETYEYRPAPRIPCRLAMFGGREDDCMDAADRQAWADEFGGPAAWHPMRGGHFFIDTHARALLEGLRAELSLCVEAALAD